MSLVFFFDAARGFLQLFEVAVEDFLIVNLSPVCQTRFGFPPDLQQNLTLLFAFLNGSMLSQALYVGMKEQPFQLVIPPL